MELTPKEKAEELIIKFTFNTRCYSETKVWEDYLYDAKQCALIAVENEYNALREQLFNLRSCRVIENEKVYLTRLDELNKLELELKQEINNL